VSAARQCDGRAELVALCVMVFESVGVTWEMTARAAELLMADVLERLNFQEQAIVRPYAEGMMAAFDPTLRTLTVTIGI
jgi:hypothetical protein